MDRQTPRHRPRLRAAASARSIAGLFGRRIGDIASMAVTTGLLFLSCALAWVVF